MRERPAILSRCVPWLAALAMTVPSLGAWGQSAGGPSDRTVAARAARHALVIGIGRYADPEVVPLPGTRFDLESATQIAQAMEVPPANIRYLQDEQATGDAIRRAIAALDASVQPGDRVFLHFSGHGTRFHDAAAGGCVEALLAHDGGVSGTITHAELARLLAPITRKTDKLFVMVDACHSGGVIARDTARVRSLASARLTPKFSRPDARCAQPANVRTRSLLVEATGAGALPQDIVHLSSARHDEMSFDDPERGGLATQYVRDCLLREARDLDGSGAISIEEVRACAQAKIEERVRGEPDFLAHHLVLTGNAAFVPAWFSQARIASPAAPAVSGAQALRQVYEQRDAKRRVQASVARDRLRIGQDRLEFTVRSDRAGYVYVAMAGSDDRTLQLLFPNDLDRDNRIEAGQPLALPRAAWRLRAAGPPGRNQLLVLVTDAPRDLAALGSKAGPFAQSLNDAAGRAALGTLLTQSRTAQDLQRCAAAGPRSPACSDAFGAALIHVEEVQ